MLAFNLCSLTLSYTSSRQAVALAEKNHTMSVTTYSIQFWDGYRKIQQACCSRDQSDLPAQAEVMRPCGVEFHNWFTLRLFASPLACHLTSLRRPEKECAALHLSQCLDSVHLSNNPQRLRQIFPQAQKHLFQIFTALLNILPACQGFV